MIFITIVVKDLLHSLRSAVFIGMTVIAPLLLVGVVYVAFGGFSSGASDQARITVGVVNNDWLSADVPPGLAVGEQLRSVLFGASVHSWLTARDYADGKIAREALEQGEVEVAVIIPQDFSARLLGGGGGGIPLRLISAPGQEFASQTVQDLLTPVLEGAVGSQLAAQVLAETRQGSDLPAGAAQLQAQVAEYNKWQAGFHRDLHQQSSQAALVMVSPDDQEATQNHLVSMLMAGQMVFFTFFGGAFSMVSILREEEEGTLGRLFATPVGLTTILAGKYGAIFLSVFLQGAVLIAASGYAFDINWGSPPGVLLALVGQAAAAVGLGALLVSFVRNSQQAGPLLGGVLSGLGMLGGLFSAGFSLPAIFTRLASATPQGWVIRTWQAVMGGGSIPEVLSLFTLLLVLGVVMFTVGVFRFRRRFV
jgi:ABC-2 type transport system permease protein